MELMLCSPCLSTALKMLFRHSSFTMHNFQEGELKEILSPDIGDCLAREDSLGGEG